MTTQNPLLDFSDLPRFDTVQPEHVKPAIESLLTAGRELIERLTADSTPATWQDFAGALSDGLEPFGRAWGIVGHLHSVNDVPAWREAYNEMLPEVSRFYAELGQNLKLFDKYKALRASAEYATLSTEQKKVVDNEVRDFRLSGAELPEDQKPRFQAIQEELSSLSAKFSENVLDATNAFAEIVTDEAVLAGLPDDVPRRPPETAAEKAGVEGWKFTCKRRPTAGDAIRRQPRTARPHVPRLRHPRRRVRTARASRNGQHAGDEPHAGAAPPKKRRCSATTITPRFRWPPRWPTAGPGAGLPARTGGQGQAICRQGHRRTARLRQGRTRLEDFQPWDAPTFGETAAGALRLLRTGSEAILHRTQGARRPVQGHREPVQRQGQAGHGAGLARGCALLPLETSTGELVGQFYLDLYARETKRGGAWMDEARSRRRTIGGIQKPVAYLNCNFARPVGGKPATFTHDDVITLFHETGHGLHHLLTRGEELGVSGIHGVEWDAVELPSQFMENYCWEWEVVEGMTAHVDTGEPLPRELFDKMLAAKNFQSGMMAVRQIEFSLFDMLLHSDFDPAGPLTVMDLLNEVRREVAVLFPPEWHRFPNSFSHIFGGGYGAGYFSYKWAEVLSADAYAAFEEAGDPFDAATGKRFLDEILSVGGSRPAIESFKAFRGREPRVDALLRHSGMIAA
jgi:oligopeptidase A